MSQLGGQAELLHAGRACEAAPRDRAPMRAETSTQALHLRPLRTPGASGSRGRWGKLSSSPACTLRSCPWLQVAHSSMQAGLLLRAASACRSCSCRTADGASVSHLALLVVSSRSN